VAHLIDKATRHQKNPSSGECDKDVRLILKPPRRGDKAREPFAFDGEPPPFDSEPPLLDSEPPGLSRRIGATFDVASSRGAPKPPG